MGTKANQYTFNRYRTDAQGAKAPVTDVAIADIDIATELNVGDTLVANGVRGVTFAAGDAVLLINQTDLSENGAYLVSAAGAATRVHGFTVGWHFLGAIIPLEGTNRLWACTNATAPAVGTDNITFAEVGAVASTIATSQTITANSYYDFAHNFGTKDILVNVWDTTTDEDSPTRYHHEGTNTLRVHNDSLASITVRIVVKK